MFLEVNFIYIGPNEESTSIKSKLKNKKTKTRKNSNPEKHRMWVKLIK